ncbi:MAG: restriction endonuclease subunit S [Pseudomonadota bacterium]|nr:restriction endonuclease subunit S [Pseudomonadota bacterium]
MTEKEEANVGCGERSEPHQSRTMRFPLVTASYGLPKGWAEAKVGDLIGHDGLFCDGDWVESKDQDPTGDVRLIQLADVGDGEYRNKSNRFLTSAKAAELRCTFLRPRDLLVARMPDPLGRVCMFPGDTKASVTVVDVCVVRPATTIHTRWLMHQLNAPQMRQRVAALQSGSTRKRISRVNFAKIPFPLPPMSEQEGIASVADELFSDLDAGVAALMRARQKLKLYRASVLKAAVEGALTAEWRAQHPHTEPAAELRKRILAKRRHRWEEVQLATFKGKGQEPPKNWKAKYKEPVPPDATNLPPLPEGWCWANLDTLLVEGPQNGLYLPNTLYGRGTEILRIDDFQNGWVRPREELKRVEADQKATTTYALRDRDLVINRVNSMTHLGKCVLATDRLEGVLFESNMMRAQVASASEAKYVELYLRSEPGRRRLTRDAKWAVNQASINQQDVKRALLPLPPLAEQEAIVDAVEDQLSVIDHLEADLDAKLKNAQVLRQAILRHAFTGQLVPQNPNDEPASELLKRIAAEREARAREYAGRKLVGARNRRRRASRGGRLPA